MIPLYHWLGGEAEEIEQCPVCHGSGWLRIVTLSNWIPCPLCQVQR